MTCEWCGTHLPADALFCSECGRSVTTSPGAVGQTDAAFDGSSEPDTTDSLQVSEVQAMSDATPPDAEIARPCRQCGAELAASDIFCGDCGYLVNPRASGEQQRNTAVIEPMLDLFAPAEAAAPRRPAGMSEAHEPDIEDTRITRSRRSGERFVLQFSTGESVAVFGSGLIGRNPRSEPSEYVDQFVRVTDPTRSVSKTHLEFGQDSGAFWVRDRFSGNGTVVREPERRPVRCEPGRRYLVPRGTRVDVGDQFFVVS